MMNLLALVFGIVAAIEQAHGGGERGHFWVQHWNDTMPVKRNKKRNILFSS